MPANDASVKHAAELLRTGGVVAFPTETVYGLGALALEPASVARIFEIKRRPRFDPLIVHVLNRAMLDEVVANVPPLADELARRFWPGPLTLVLPKRGSVPALVTSGLPTVAVRMPSHRIARSLLQAVGGPIAAPSANRFGSLSPTRAEHVDESLNDDVDLILDGGSTEFGIESTIVAFDPEPSVLRPGALEIEALEAIVGPIAVISEGPARAPGMLRRHYAPRTPLRLIDPATVPVSERVGAGVLSLRDRFDGYAEMRVLSPSGDLREAAAAFFEALHELDSAKLGRIDAQPIDDGGLGLAMMDRLRRAAASRNV
ncbi:MAG: threonylcarbamoyl-AMP synthase [Candidatus Eremiobacteraeota bacterium]|nr:threonylcarbamoyl-AMP synthase [Candidatus Eremiobacteraeota bacterium]